MTAGLSGHVAPAVGDDNRHHSSGQGSTIFQRCSPFLIFFISVVSRHCRGQTKSAVA
jgi:hypothetical protein